MYEIMMYAGAIGCIVFFLISVVLFIKNKIPASIMYFVNLRRKGVDIWSANKKLAQQKTAKVEKTLLLQKASEKTVQEQTQLLEDADSESTTFIDTENTELLEEADMSAPIQAVQTVQPARKEVSNSKKKTKKKKQPKAERSRVAGGSEPTELLGGITQQAGGSEPTELLDYIAQQASGSEPTELLDDLPSAKGFQPTELLDDIPDYYTVGSQTELLD